MKKTNRYVEGSVMGGHRQEQKSPAATAGRLARVAACAVVVASFMGGGLARDAAAQTAGPVHGQADVADRMLRLADTLAEMSIRMGNLFGGAADYKLYRLYAGKQLHFSSEFFSNLNGGWSLSGLGEFNVDDRYGTFPDSVLAQVRSNLIDLEPGATAGQIMAAAGAALGVPTSGGQLLAANRRGGGSSDNGRILAAIGQSMAQLQPGGGGGNFRGPPEGPGGSGEDGTPPTGSDEQTPPLIVYQDDPGLDQEDGPPVFGPKDNPPQRGPEPQLVQVTQVPEPGTLAASGIGLTVLGFFAWRRRRRT